MSDATLPAAIGDPRLHQIPWLSCYWRGSEHITPTLLVLHSGASGNNVARWLHSPVWRETDELRALREAGKTRSGSLRLCRDGFWRRMGAAHINSTSHNGDFTQGEYLDTRSPHAGKSVCQGRGNVNGRSLGLELPAHAGKDLLAQFRVLLRGLVQQSNGLVNWTRHKDIKRGKTDPVCWDLAECREAMDGSGLGYVV